MHRTSNTLCKDVVIIAVIAQAHHLTVVTRNVSDFQNFDVKLFNPFDGMNLLSLHRFSTLKPPYYP